MSLVFYLQEESQLCKLQYILNTGTPMQVQLKNKARTNSVMATPSMPIFQIAEGQSETSVSIQMIETSQSFTSENVDSVKDLNISGKDHNKRQSRLSNNQRGRSSSNVSESNLNSQRARRAEQPSQSPKGSPNSRRWPKKHVAKQFELMPNFLSSVGTNFPDLDPSMIEFAKNLAGGLISRFAFFQNVFRPDIHEREITGNDPDGALPASTEKANVECKDHRQQVKDLLLDTDWCYPSIQKSKMESELEHFSKQIITALNTTLKKSGALTKNVAKSNLNLQVACPIPFDRQASNLSNFSSHLGANIVSQAQQATKSIVLDGAKSSSAQQIEKMKADIAELEKTIEEKDNFINKMRSGYTRDLQNLRNALAMAVDPINRAHQEQVKLTMNVYNFNDLENLSPELVTFFNEKLQIVKEEAQMQIDKVTANVSHLIEKIEKYKSLKPENYSLMEMSLEDIFSGVSVIQPSAFPVWQKFMQAFPPDHFAGIIKQVAEQLNENSDETYDKLILMVKDGINAGNNQTQRILELCKKRNDQYYEELKDAREEISTIQWREQRLLEAQEMQLTEMHNKFVQDEIQKVKNEHIIDKKSLNTQIKLQAEEINRIERSREHIQIRLVLFKWRQAGIVSRFIDNLKSDTLDNDSLKDLLHEDMRKLFFSLELHQLSNSLKQEKLLFKNCESRLKQYQSDNYELRLKVNRLLTDHQAMQMKQERYRVREWDLMRQFDIEKRKRHDTQDEKEALMKKNLEISDVLSRQIKLKEMFEDKLKDTLDMRFSPEDAEDGNAFTMGTGAPKSAMTENELRQKTTKRVLQGFEVERQSLLLEHQDKLNRLKKNVTDLNYRKEQVHQECQTEIQAAISRKLDLVILYDVPFKMQNNKACMSDQDTMTDISTNIVDFLAGGSQKYEQLVTLGLIKAVTDQKAIDESVEQYIQRLAKMEEQDGILFTQRAKNIKQAIPGLRKKQNKTATKTMSSQGLQHANTLIKRSPTLRAGTSTQLQVGKLLKSGTKVMSPSISHLVSVEDQDEDSLGSDTASDKKKRKSKAKKKPTTGGHSLDELVDPEKFVMKPKLNNKNYDLSDTSDLEVDDSDSVSVTSHRRKKRSPARGLEKITEVPNYREIVERKNAVSLFDTYLRVFDVMVQLEPSLLKTAAKSVKKHTSCKLDMVCMLRFKRLYPDLIPDVFWRLFSTSKDEKQLQQRAQLLANSKLLWNQRLVDQGRLDEAQSVEEIKIVANDSMTDGDATIETASQPYLKPVDLTISQDGNNSTLQVDQDPIGVVLKKKKTKSPGKKSKHVLKNNASMMTETMHESTQLSDYNNNHPYSKGQIPKMISGFYSMPRTAHDMRVSILPKNHTALRSSVQVPHTTRPLNQQFKNEICRHLSFDNAIKKPVTRPSKAPYGISSQLFDRGIKTSQVTTINASKKSTRQISPEVEIRDGEVVFQDDDLANHFTTHDIPDRLIKVQSGGQNILSMTSLANKMVKQKRPSTCRPGRDIKQQSKSASMGGVRTSKKSSTTGMASMRQVLVSKRLQESRGDMSSTQNETFASTRPLSGVGTNVNIGDMMDVKRRSGQNYTQLLSGSLEQHRDSGWPGKSSGTCPIKAFNMNSIPISQQDQMRGSLLNEFASKTSYSLTSQQMSRFDAQKKRAQSATNNSKMRRKTTLTKQTLQGQTEETTLQLTLNKMLIKPVQVDSQGLIGKNNQRVAIKVRQPINMNSEEQFQPFQQPNNNFEFIDKEEAARHGHSSSSMTVEGKRSELDLDRPLGRNSARLSTTGTALAPEKQNSLIKVSDQLDCRNDTEIRITDELMVAKNNDLEVSEQH